MTSTLASNIAAFLIFLLLLAGMAAGTLIFP